MHQLYTNLEDIYGNIRSCIATMLYKSYFCYLIDFVSCLTLQLDLAQQMAEGDMTNYKANGEFDLIAFTSVRTVEIYSCCPEPYPDITYTIRLKRRPMFYVFNLILPCLLINGIGKLSRQFLQSGLAYNIMEKCKP